MSNLSSWLTRLVAGFLLLTLSSNLPQGHAATYNVAPRGTAYSNRPLYAGWNIAGLNDGDTQAVLHADTQPGAGLAYTLDLGKDYMISELKIYPRQDACCPERLANFRVSIHHDNGQGAPGTEVWGVNLFTDGSNPGSGPGTIVPIPFPSPQPGRWIQIAALGDNPPNYSLQMTELEVFANVPLANYNLALHAPVSVNGPLYNDFSPSSLTDGHSTGAGNGIVHGDVNLEPDFAYEINLGTPIQLDKIIIWARQDGFHPERLSNYRVSLHQDDNGRIGTAVWQADLHPDGSNPGADPGSKDEITAELDPSGPFTGQWIRVQSLDNPVPDYALQMTEVEAFGTPAGQPALIVTQQPQDLVAGLGATGVFEVGAFLGGGDPDHLSYQWQLNGADLPGETNAIFATPPTGGSDDGGKYRCVVSYPGLASQTTVEAALHINVAYHAAVASNRKVYAAYRIDNLVDGNPGSPVHLDTAPAAGAAYKINLGIEYNLKKIVIWARQDGHNPERLTNLRVLVHKNDNGTLGEAVWQTDLLTDGGNPGAHPGTKIEVVADPSTTNSFRGQWIQILSLEDPVQDYALQIGEVEVFGTPSAGVKLLISQQPQDAAIAVGGAAVFTVVATVPGGSPAQIKYQWQANGVDISGATNATYRTPLLFDADEGKKYQCVLGYSGLPSQSTVEVTTRFNRALGADVLSGQPLWGGLQLGALVDGNHTTFVHLDVAPEIGAAYTINLGEIIKLSRIDLWPRQDGLCQERFTNLRVSLHKDNRGQIGDIVWQTDLYTDGSNPGSAPGTVVKLEAAKDPDGQFEGQWVQILSLEDPVQDYSLQISEVEVFGQLASAPITAPALTIGRIGNQITISWPAEPAGFVLQQNDDLSKPAAWISTPGGDRSPATMTLTGHPQYFRMIKR